MFISDNDRWTLAQREQLIELGGDYEVEPGETFDQALSDARSRARIFAMAKPGAPDPRETDIPGGLRASDESDQSR